jgi:hypothetical protein
MKKIFASILLIAISVPLIAADDAKSTAKHPKTPAKAAAKEQKFDGWVSDEKCGVKIDADCARKCEAAGVKMVFVDLDKNVIPVANTEALKGFAGQHVNIKGTLENGSLTVTSVKAAVEAPRKL